MHKGKSTVLIVDDVTENIDVLTGALKGDYKVKAARSGAQALKLLANSALPDIILLDIMMPEMDGYEVIDALKSDEKTKEIPVIFVTAKGESVDEAKGLSLGASDYIVKPISPIIVKARVAAHVKLYHQQLELGRQIRVLENKLMRFCPAKEEKNVATPEPEDEVLDYQEYFLEDHRMDLAELIDEIDSVINFILMRDTLDDNRMRKAGLLMSRYASILMFYPIFKRLGSGMLEFSQMFQTEALNPTHDNLVFAFGCLESLIYTLDRWHHQVFENALKDPNVFDNSMLADMETIQMALRNSYGEEDDAIEFF